MENHETRTVTLGELFVASLQAREEAGKSVVPSDQIDLLQISAGHAFRVLEQVALFGAADDVLLVSLIQKLQHPGVLASPTPENEPKLKELKGLLQAIDGFRSQYRDAVAFCRQHELMTRRRILTEAGINPDDTAAVTAFYTKVERTLITTPGNPNS